MNTKPNVSYLSTCGGSFWTNTFKTFSATVFVPDNEYTDDVLNYGYLAPYLLVFSPKKFEFEEAASFAKENGFEELAKKYATSVVYIYPTAEGGWKNASPEIFAEILTNSKIHQYHEDGMAKAYNRFTKELEGYYIRGAIFRSCLFGYGDSADYIGQYLLRHFEGDGLWGRADSAPTVCILNGCSKIPVVEANDIPVISIGNSDEINAYLKKNVKDLLIKEKQDVVNDHETFGKYFRRMCGILEKDPDLEAMGLSRDPGVAIIPTSPDNSGDDKGTSEHAIGYFAFYEKNLLKNGPVPTLLCFHGGGDSAFYISYLSGWAEIALKYGFLLVSIENHINSTATEMAALLEELKKKYPIDSTRVYCSGFSMGGCKSWDMIQEYPSILAAAAPMDATFEVGLNVFGEPMKGELNTTVSVPVFYAGGAITPLPELPFQAQKCLDRQKYIMELNKVKAKYDVKLEDAANWANPIWGIDGDKQYSALDPDRRGVLNIELFDSEDGRCISAFASISNQGHECRKHTCENAWRFMRNFRRLSDGTIEGGDINTIYNCFTF